MEPRFGLLPAVRPWSLRSPGMMINVAAAGFVAGPPPYSTPTGSAVPASHPCNQLYRTFFPFKLTRVFLFQINEFRGTWPAQSLEHATLGLEVVSSGPTWV